MVIQKKYTGKVGEISTAILQEPAGTFRSSWAQNIHKELQIVAEAANRNMNTAEAGHEDPIRDDEFGGYIPDVWEERWTDEVPVLTSKKKRIPLIRKPVIVTDCFVIPLSSDESETDTELSGWSALDRRRR